MTVVIDGTLGISPVTASGTSASVDGMTVGRGGGEVAQNTVVGANAGVANTTGKITAVGYLAARFNTTGSGNTALGGNDAAQDGALYYNTTGNYNIAVGTGSVASNTTGSSNTGIGYSALQNNTTASNNTAVGYQAGYTNATGARITAVGYQALTTSTVSDNTGIGFNSLGNTTTGNYNVAVGCQDASTYAAMNNNTSGAQNVAVGAGASARNTTANYNVAVGYQALYSNLTANKNTAVGFNAGYPTTGAGNTLIGDETGYGAVSLSSGTYNTLIGQGSSTNTATDSYELVVTATGVQTSANTGKGTNTGYIATYNGSAFGSIYQGNNSAAWAITSDQRLKKNIVDNTDGLSKILAIRVRNFEYRLPEEVTELDSKNAIAITGIQLGAIAQELQQVLPECVKTEATGVMTVDTDNLTWYLINAVKELTARVAQLEGN